MSEKLQACIRDSIILQLNVLGFVGQLYDCSDLTLDYIWNINMHVNRKLDRLSELYVLM